MISTNNKFYFKKFYKAIDGNYNSFWAGRLINILLKTGNKKTVEKAAEQANIYIKLKFRKLPVLMLLESLVKVKPIFNIGVVVSRGKERQYPILLKKSKQFLLALHWLASLITERKEWYLSQRYSNELADTINNKKHVLIQKRDKIFKATIKNRANMRYLS